MFCLVVLPVLAFVGDATSGCKPSELPEVAAAAGYEAQQMACVDSYDDKPSIDACRARVRAAWATDGGKDGAK